MSKKMLDKSSPNPDKLPLRTDLLVYAHMIAHQRRKSMSTRRLILALSIMMLMGSWGASKAHASLLLTVSTQALTGDLVLAATDYFLLQ